MKARFAQLLFTILGYEVEIIRGYFRSPERWTLHVWIRVSGREYDPSVGNLHVDADRHSITNPDPELRGWEQIPPQYPVLVC